MNSGFHSTAELVLSPSSGGFLVFTYFALFFLLHTLTQDLEEERGGEVTINVLLDNSKLASVLSGLAACFKLSFMDTSMDSLKILLPRTSDHSFLVKGNALFKSYK